MICPGTGEARIDIAVMGSYGPDGNLRELCCAQCWQWAPVYAGRALPHDDGAGAAAAQDLRTPRRSTNPLDRGDVNLPSAA